MNRGTDRIEPGLGWRRVNAESARMRSLVEDLLLLARLDEGRPLQSGEVDLAAEAVGDARAAAAAHVWRLELNLSGRASVLGDEARPHQVVANLLANARVHTPAGTTVTATVEGTAATCVIRAHDDGPGIPPELLPAVFERSPAPTPPAPAPVSCEAARGWAWPSSRRSPRPTTATSRWKACRATRSSPSDSRSANARPPARYCAPARRRSRESGAGRGGVAEGYGVVVNVSKSASPVVPDACEVWVRPTSWVAAAVGTVAVPTRFQVEPSVE